MSKNNHKKTAKPAASAVKTNSTPAAGAQTIDIREAAKVTGILTAICAVIALLLALTNHITADKIAQSAKQQEIETCAQVFAPQEGQTLYYEPLSEVHPECEQDGYLVLNGDLSVAGCIINCTVKGYGGDIVVMVGFDMDKNVTGVSLLSHSETPGLGANAAKEDFLGQFVSPSDGTSAGDFAVSKDGGTVDSVTAATISSRAVTNAVNLAADTFDSLKAGGFLVLPEGYDPNGSAPSVPASGSDAVVSGGDVSVGASASDASSADTASPSDNSADKGGEDK